MDTFVKPDAKFFFILRSLKRAISNTLVAFNEQTGGSCVFIDEVKFNGLFSTSFIEDSVENFHIEYSTKTDSNCEIFIEGNILKLKLNLQNSLLDILINVFLLATYNFVNALK